MNVPAQRPEIDIVVHPEKRPDTSSKISLRSLHRTASFETRTGQPLAPSDSAGGHYGACSTEGVALGSSAPSTQNTSSVDLKIAHIEGLEPITASEVMRNDRKRIIPKPKSKKIMIQPGKTDYDDLQGRSDWAPIVHPDGALYFFDSKRRIYTDADLSADDEHRIISYYADLLLQERSKIPGFPWDICELVLERTDTGCGYYFVEPTKRCIIWLHHVPIDRVTNGLPRVESMAHIKYAMEAEYWTHCVHFPNKWSVTADVVAELKKMVLHAITDNVVSTTSVIPFDQEELAKILDIIDGLKDEINELFPHANCIVARFMHEFASAKFFNFCGQPGARLNSDQSIFHKSRPRRSLLITILSFCLFWAPYDYAKELDGIWVDKVMNRIMWKRFIANLNNDWSGLALSATVILNANVAFLALTDDNAVAKSFSFVSTVTSVGVVLIGLILVRQSQRQDSAEQGDKFLGKMSLPIFDTEVLAVMFSLPYALLLWSMVCFVIAFACMVFSSAHAITQRIFGLVFALICSFVLGTTWAIRTTGR